MSPPAVVASGAESDDGRRERQSAGSRGSRRVQTVGGMSAFVRTGGPGPPKWWGRVSAD